MTGDTIMRQLGLYSGNLSTIPNGEQLATRFDDSDYVRLWATVSTGKPPQHTLPCLARSRQ